MLFIRLLNILMGFFFLKYFSFHGYTSVLGQVIFLFCVWKLYPSLVLFLVTLGEYVDYFIYSVLCYIGSKFKTTHVHISDAIHGYF